MSPISLEIKLVLAAIFALAIFSGGAYSGYRWEASALDARVAADAQLEAANIKIAALTQGKLDQNAIDAANSLTAKAQHEAAITQATIIRIPTYVTKTQDARGCVTYGFIRLLDARAIGVDPETLALPAGATNDTCSPFVSSVLADSIVRNYARYHTLEDNFDTLVDLDKKDDAALAGTDTKPPNWFERNNPF